MTIKNCTFYDLSSSLNPEFFSHNTGKVRVLLNYYGIPYELKFLKYQEITPVLSSLGVLSWPEQGLSENTSYTLPAMTFVKSSGESETVMGGDFFILDKVKEYYGKDVYAGNAPLIKAWAEYRKLLVSIVRGAIGPFVYNILDDEETKKCYYEARLFSGRGDMVQLQSSPTEKFIQCWDNFKKEIASFASFEKVAKESGLDDAKIKESRALLDAFLRGDTDFIIGDELTYCDSSVFAVIVWALQAVKGGAPEFDILSNEFWNTWYEKVAVYNI